MPLNCCFASRRGARKILLFEIVRLNVYYVLIVHTFIDAFAILDECFKYKISLDFVISLHDVFEKQVI